MLAVVFLPTLLFFFGIASSGGLGTIIAALMLMATAPRVSTRLPSPGAICLALVAGVAIHLVVAGVFLPIEGGKALSSLASLVIVVLAGCALGRTLLVCNPRRLHRALMVCFVALCVVAVLPKVGLPIADWLNGSFTKPLFPFTEPSHFSLVFLPFLMYVCATSTGRRKVAMVALGFGIAMLVENLTMIVGCVLISTVTLRPRLFVFAAITLAVVATQLDLSYYQARLDVTDGALERLSPLVYIQGWELIDDSLGRSFGWGIGFQQLGLHEFDSDAAELIYKILGEYANTFDGGFTLAKLISEFGLVGIVALGFYGTKVARSFVDLRRQPAPTAETFAKAVILCFLVELLVRGVGYFTGTTILLVASLWLLAALRPRSARHRRRAVADAASATPLSAA